MTKLFDFIKARPYITVNSLGAAVVLLCFFPTPIVALGCIAAVIAYFLLFRSVIGFAILLVFNVSAFIAVIKDKPILGMLLSLPLGSLGALIGTLFNYSYKNTKAVKIILNIHIWICVWGVASFFLMQRYV